MKLKPPTLKVLFFSWCLGPFLVAVRNIRDRRYHGVILLFAIVYGYSVYLYSGDVTRYAESFETMVYASWGDYWELLQGVLAGDNANRQLYGLTASQPDIYAFSMQFLVSRITEDARWFFAIVSLIYTVLFLKFTDEAVREIPWVNTYTQKVFFGYLLLVIPFFVGVTGVRFWTALFLFMLFAIRYIRNHESKYILGAAFSPLIHFTFIVPVGLLLIYRIMNLNRKFTVVAVLLSIGFFLVSSNGQVLNYVQRSSILFGETKVSDRLESYGDQELLDSRLQKSAQTNWYVKARAKLLVSILLVLTVVELFRGFRFQENGFTENLYPFYLLFFIVTMFTYNLGSVGRFQNIFYLVALLRYAILAGLNPQHRTLKKIALTLSPVLVLHVLVTFRAGFYTVDPLLLVGNPAIIYMYQSGLSLSELIVGH